MSDLDGEIPDNSNCQLAVRPSLAQVKALVSYMEKNPELANRKRMCSGNPKFKKQWVEISNMLNSINGSVKSMKGWIKFWTDKKRLAQKKQKGIEDGRLKSSLTTLEKKILNICGRKRIVKQEPCNGDDGDDSYDHSDVFIKGEQVNVEVPLNRVARTEADLKQLTVIEKMIGVMDQQASALSEIAQASLTNSKALERIAEASHMQALAVDRLVGTFGTISGTAHDIRNAILGIDYTLKRCYPTQHRTNTTLFS